MSKTIWVAVAAAAALALFGLARDDEAAPAAAPAAINLVAPLPVLPNPLPPAADDPAPRAVWVPAHLPTTAPAAPPAPLLPSAKRVPALGSGLAPAPAPNLPLLDRAGDRAGQRPGDLVAPRAGDAGAQ